MSKIFIMTVINTGGDGKTTITLLIQALFQLAALDYRMLDAGQGNFALKSRFFATTLTRVVWWHLGPDVVPNIIANCEDLPVFMDTGPNMFASEKEIVNLVPALRNRFAENGYRTVALMPVSTSKFGAAEALTDFASKLDAFEKIVVKNDRDGSNEFETTADVYPMICMPHLASGLNAYLFRSKRSIADVVTNPEPGYTKASARIAHWVRTFASDPHVQSLLGNELCESALRQLPPAPMDLCFVLKTFDHASDQNIGMRERDTPTAKLVNQFGWTASGLRQAADVLDAQTGSL